MADDMSKTTNERPEFDPYTEIVPTGLPFLDAVRKRLTEIGGGCGADPGEFLELKAAEKVLMRIEAPFAMGKSIAYRGGMND